MTTDPWKEYTKSDEYKELVQWVGWLNQGIMERPFFAGYRAARKEMGLEDD